MSLLRPLALCFLVSASAFSLAKFIQTDPDFRRELGARVEVFHQTVWQPALMRVRAAADNLLQTPTSTARVVLALQPPTPAEERALARIELAPIERPGITERSSAMLDTPIVIEPSLPSIRLPPERQAAKPLPQAAPLPPRVEDARPVRQAMTREQMRARVRLIANLSDDMRRNFDLFLFVSKASGGPLAQRMYVFRKQAGDLSLLYDWAASTGREQQEINARGQPSFTGTPSGFYQFDPARMYARYRSYSWDQPMPHAMFFNWRREGIQTGLAIHAAEGTDRLGTRASAGCLQLSPENARTLYELVRSEYRGQAPRFSVDRNDTMSNQGRFARAADGSLRMASGYRVLINIENYSGLGDDSIADVMF